jgi:hypothetical protein
VIQIAVANSAKFTVKQLPTPCIKLAAADLVPLCMASSGSGAHDQRAAVQIWRIGSSAPTADIPMLMLKYGSRAIRTSFDFSDERGNPGTAFIKFGDRPRRCQIGGSGKYETLLFRSSFEELVKQLFGGVVQPVDLVLVKMLPIRGPKQSRLNQNVRSRVALQNTHDIFGVVPPHWRPKHRCQARLPPLDQIKARVSGESVEPAPKRMVRIVL